MAAPAAEPGATPAPSPVNPWLGEDFDIDFEFRPGEVSDMDAEEVDAARRFRDVLGRFASGVAVMTGVFEGEPVGMTCQSFASVSLVPPLVLFCPARTSRAWPLIRRSGGFAVNILAEDQAEASNRMATRGEGKFAGLTWEPAPVTGSPLLPGTVAHLDCTIHAVHEAGDHFVVIGRVLDLGSGPAQRPLLFHRGRYAGTVD